MTRAATLPGRREEILKAAGELFGARGYHGTGMRELAGVLDLKGSSLYAHIAGKEDLLWEIVDRAAEAFVNAAEAVPDDLAPVDRLEALMAAHLRVIGMQLDHAAVFFQDWVHLSEDRRRDLVARRDAYQERFRAAIHDGVADGSLQVEDVQVATLVVLSALNFSYQWYDPGGRLGPAAVARAYAQVLLDGMRSRPAPSGEGNDDQQITSGRSDDG